MVGDVFPPRNGRHPLRSPSERGRENVSAPPAMAHPLREGEREWSAPPAIPLREGERECRSRLFRSRLWCFGLHERGCCIRARVLVLGDGVVGMACPSAARHHLWVPAFAGMTYGSGDDGSVGWVVVCRFPSPRRSSFGFVYRGEGVTAVVIFGFPHVFCILEYCIIRAYDLSTSDVSRVSFHGAND